MTTTALALPTKMSILLTERRDSIESALPKWIDADRFIITAMMALNRSWKLQNCTETSFYLSILESARSGLLPDGKEAAIIPYKDQAEFQPMAVGITRLMLRAEGVLKIEARCVHKGDYFDFAYGDEPYVKHKPEPGTDREVIAAYAILWRKETSPTPEITWRDEIDKARQQSRAPNGPHWTIWFSETCRKVPIKRLGKYIDLDSWAEHAIALDHAITGDPSMSGTIYEPSEKYQNQLTKTRTVARLEELKEDLNGESDDPEPPAFDEKKAQPVEAGTPVFEKLPEGETFVVDTANEKKEEPKPDPEPETKEPVRLENQWEKPILKFLIDNEMVGGEDKIVRQHRLAHILNQSPFMEIPYGELDIVEATAWVLGWEKIKTEHPRTKWENRLKQVQELWVNEQEKNALIDLASKHIPPDQGEPE